MGKKHEVTRVVLDSLGCKLNQAERAERHQKKEGEAARREAEKPALFKRLDTKKGGLDK